MPSEFALVALLFCLSGNLPGDVETESASRSAAVERAITEVQRVYESLVQSLRIVASPNDVSVPGSDSKLPVPEEGPSDVVENPAELQTLGTVTIEEPQTEANQSDVSGSAIEDSSPVTDVELIPSPGLESERVAPDLQNTNPAIQEQKTDTTPNVDDVPILPDLPPESDSATLQEQGVSPDVSAESPFDKVDAAVTDENAPETSVEVNAIESGETVVPVIGSEGGSEAAPESRPVENEPSTRGAETAEPIERGFESIDLCQLRPAQFAG